MITVISACYNEEFLLPFFLRHYSFADRIIILLDDATTDNSDKIIRSFGNTEIVSINYPDGWNNIRRVKGLVKIYNSVLINNSSWVLFPDIDEFIRMEEWDLDVLRQNETGDINAFNVSLYQVFRHKTDLYLTLEKPIIYQRVHGDPNITEGINKMYTKPIIVKSGLENLFISPGLHAIFGNIKYGDYNFVGAHWAKADHFCIDRILNNRKPRYSQEDIDKGWGNHNRLKSREDLIKILQDHDNDPIVIKER